MTKSQNAQAAAADTASTRAPQLAYSELQQKTRDEQRRKVKAAKIAAVLRHFFGSDDLGGLTAVDIGCSTGYTADALREAGADVIGIDIDVPGVAYARSCFGSRADFLVADGSALPFPDASVDIVVFNHIYEHVVDPDAVLAEIRRVLKPEGAAYFGFGNKYQVIEPHYRLPFLSWLPYNLADRYIAKSGKAEDYYERFRTRAELVRMCEGLALWDYTYTVLADAEAFHAEDMVPPRLRTVPVAFWRSLRPIMPTFIWVATPGDRRPEGQPTRQAPARIKA